MNKKSFTLIEVLASIVLLSGALIPLMVIVPQMIRNSLKSEQLTKVVFLAENKMEEVKCKTIDTFATSRDETVTAFSSPYGDYKYTVTDDEGADIKIIQVQTWYDENGDSVLDSGESSIIINTKVADRG